MLEVRDISKQYEGRPLLHSISFKLDAGETVCLLGPSGSGKSTLLRIIAGIETAEAGQVLWDGLDLSNEPSHRRGFGLMFQDYALFPHLNVADNVAFGLRMQRLAEAEVGSRVQEALAQVNLQRFATRRVTDLSGGEQQRVALARALAPRPRLLMLDEPLGALDRSLREQLLEELRRLLHLTGIPAIYVTHDQEEAFYLADRLILLREGQIEQSGPPAAVFNNPASAWAARFLGQTNLIAGRLVNGSGLSVETQLGCFPVEVGQGVTGQAGEAVTVLFRSGGARLVEPGDREAMLKGQVEDVVFRGDGFLMELGLPGGTTFHFFVDEAVEVGQTAALALAAGSLLALPEEA